jgi:hypothetical protein
LERRRKFADFNKLQAYDRIFIDLKQKELFFVGHGGHYLKFDLAPNINNAHSFYKFFFLKKARTEIEEFIKEKAQECGLTVHNVGRKEADIIEIEFKPKGA